MAQGILGGMSNYGDQSMADIIEDINKWIFYANQVKGYIEEGITTLKEKEYWNKVPFNFQVTLISSVRCQKTFIEDLSFILKAIEKEQLTPREINLMKKIGIKAIEYNNEFGRTYKEEYDWKEYGNENFKIAENMYSQGRDFFVTLQDAGNVSVRLNDYINTVPSVVNNNITQTVTGSGNLVTGINNGEINNVHINISDFNNELDSALLNLKESNDVDQPQKIYLAEILEESREAVTKGDLSAQAITKSKMKSFLVGAGSKALSIINLLGTYASIASYFEF
ncbi:hypothetical protein [Rossellomorea marisflavi]|uniref:hypothetical protein n=1 Tax=Rossellomorea marisflavi TaxID=189381 RepID=UPI00207A75E2|nr:hypothetical protein [Rossellomorea marisflavi]USK92867.1 hypothetical protein LIT29_03730 [Rossellomorea marisflavi]